MAAPRRTLVVQVVGDTRQYDKAMVTASASTDRLQHKQKELAKSSAMVAAKITAVGGVAVAVGIGYAVKKAADFEQQLSSLGAVASASGRQMTQLRKQAIQAGAATKFSALDAAKAQTELAKGGLSTSQILKGGLKSALALAAAGEMNLADAASTTVNAMKLFGLHGKDAMKVADGFATAANKTTADVSDFALSLAQGGSAAKAAGLNFKQTTAWLEALAEVGIKGSDAGTSLKTALAQIAAPTKQASKVAQEFGLNFFKANGSMKSLTSVAALLRDKLGGLSNQQRLLAIKQLAGTDGMRALLALYDAGPRKIDRFQKQLGKQGTAAEVAKKKQDNLKGSLENLGGSIETLAIQVGTAMLPVLHKASDELTHFTNQVSKILARDDLSLGDKLNRIFHIAKVDAQPWIEKLKAALDKADIPGKIAAIISGGAPLIAKAAAKAGITGAQVFAKSFVDSDVWGKVVLGGWLLARMGGIPAFTKMGVEAGAGFGAGMAEGAGGAGLAGKLKGALGGAGLLAKRFATVDVALNLVSAKGNPIVAGINSAHDLTFGIVPKIKYPSADERIQAQLDKAGTQIDRLSKARNFGALATLAASLRKDADEARNFGRTDVAKKIDGQVAAINAALKPHDAYMRKVDEVRKGVNANWDLMAANSRTKLSDIQDQVRGAGKYIAKQLGRGSDQGRKALSDNFAQAAAAVAKKMGTTVGAVRDAMRNGEKLTSKGAQRIRAYLIDGLTALGLSKAQANAKLTTGTIQTDRGPGSGGGNRGAQRGWYVNQGAPTGDTVPAMLERGEYVLNRRAVRQVGKGNLDRLNFAHAPRFQVGGQAGRGGVGFVPLPSTNFSVGDEPRIVADLRKLAQVLRTTVYGISGYRSPQHSASVGGFSNDPHTRGQAADIGAGSASRASMFGVSEATLRRVGLYRPFYPPNANEVNHVQLLASMVGGAAGAAITQALKAPHIKGVSTDMAGGPGAMVNQALSVARGAAQGVANRAAASMSGGGGGSNSANMTLGRQMMLKAGFPASQWPALKALWTRESGWDANAVNKSSGAYGIPQALGHGHPFNLGDAGAQIAWGLNYIKGRYGSPAGAWAHEQSAGWYQRGGLIQMLKGGGGISDGGSPAIGHPSPHKKATPGQKLADLFKGVPFAGKGRRKKLRGIAKAIRSIDVPKAIRDRITGLAAYITAADDFAGRAGQLTDPDAIIQALQDELDKRVAVLPADQQAKLANNPTPADIEKVFPAADQQKIVDGMLGRFHGRTQLDWLGSELGWMFDERNSLIDAAGIAHPKIDELKGLIGKSVAKLGELNPQIAHDTHQREQIQGEIDDLKKLLVKEQGKPKKKRDPKKIASIKAQIAGLVGERKKVGGQIETETSLRNAIQKVLGAKGDSTNTTLYGREANLRADLNDSGGWLDTLNTLQGPGSPMTKMPATTATGALSGTIFDTQFEIGDLIKQMPRATTPNVTGTTTGTADTSPDVELLQQLLREANLRTAVSERAFRVFSESGDLPHFGGGGVVPGPHGAAVPAVVHGGEGVFTPDQMQALGGTGHVVVVVQDGAVREDRIKVIAGREAETFVRRQARVAGRALPGGGGGLRRG